MQKKFADDSVLFSSANLKNVHNLKVILAVFYYSGLRIKYHKPSVSYIGKDLERQVELANDFGFPLVNLPQ